jgi:hypothetical protein
VTDEAELQASDPGTQLQNNTVQLPGAGQGSTHGLLAPGAADGHNLLTVEGELLLEALRVDRVTGAQGGVEKT